VALRVITLLLAVVLMTTAATSVSASDLTTPDAVANIVADDTPDVDTPVVPAATTVVIPDRLLVQLPSEPVALDAGRMHAVTVFRPPRATA